MTYIHVEKDSQTRSVHAFFGYQLAQIPACAVEMVDKVRQAQFQWLGNLVLPSEAALELRYLVKPANSVPNVRILLFCRVTQRAAKTASETTKRAMELAQATATHLEEALTFFLSPFYCFEALCDSKTFLILSDWIGSIAPTS